MRSVIITGGSRGLGLGMGRHLVRAGYRVIAIARQETEQLTSAMAEAAAAGDAMHFFPFDLSHLDEIPNLVKRLRSRFGSIYGLVNNAGIGTGGLLSMMPDTQVNRLISLNITSPILVSKYVARCMMAHGSGRIVNIASIVGFAGFSGLSVYSASKASLFGFTKSLARELGPLGITVNAIAPGFVDTDMTNEMTEGKREQVIRRSALKRFAGVDDVAATAEFLLSEKAKNITGTVLTVDAGGTA
jgi:3-oxoacyl-[acyl-carrier protein] reductase